MKECQFLCARDKERRKNAKKNHNITPPQHSLTPPRRSNSIASHTPPEHLCNNNETEKTKHSFICSGTLPRGFGCQGRIHNYMKNADDDVCVDYYDGDGDDDVNNGDVGDNAHDGVWGLKGEPIAHSMPRYCRATTTARKVVT